MSENPLDFARDPQTTLPSILRYVELVRERRTSTGLDSATPGEDIGEKLLNEWLSVERPLDPGTFPWILERLRAMTDAIETFGNPLGNPSVPDPFRRDDSREAFRPTMVTVPAQSVHVISAAAEKNTVSAWMSELAALSVASWQPINSK